MQHYKIAVSVNDSAYQTLGVFGMDSVVIRARTGSKYKFISLATDSAGNREAPPANPIAHPDAVVVFTVLPLQLLSFTANSEGGANRLRWRTAEEKNTAYFDVEWQANGNPFAAIGRVTAAGASSGELAYTYLHQAPATGRNFYRLRMVERDGYERCSPVRAVDVSRAAALVIKPNPANQTVSVLVPSAGGTLRFVNASGKVVHEVALSAGEFSIYISGWAPGFYFANYHTTNGRVFNYKLVVQR